MMRTPSPATRFFDAGDGARLAHGVAGDGPPLVFLHAGIADRHMWDPQLDAFSARFRVILPDLRGFGQSDLPPGRYAWREDVYSLLAHLGVERASFAGCSIGAGVALDAAVERPDLVHALVLAGPTGGDAVPRSDVLRRYGEAEEAAEEAGDAGAFVDVNVRTWVDGPNRSSAAVPPAVREYVRTCVRQDFARDWSQARHERPSPPAFTRLEDVRAPTLLVAGDQDVPDVLQAVDHLLAHVPHAQRHVIPDTAHLPNMEQPATFNRLLLEFLAVATRAA